jgi:archaellum component FlaC
MQSEPNRLDRMESLLERFMVASEHDRVASNERLTRIEQVVESNNRFLEAFSTDLRSYTQRIDNLADKLDLFSSRMDGVVATSKSRQTRNHHSLSIH